MVTPTQNQLHRPILEILSEAGHPMDRSDLASAAAKHLSLNEADLSERTSSGNQTKFANRLGWATTCLNKANVLESPSRGRYAILPAGHELLARVTG